MKEKVVIPKQMQFLNTWTMTWKQPWVV